ncbi:AsnC family transcriptional regulator [Agromyces sp. CFH 90414]|uniref:AsnC family transcriptional regulator n=1 Tax=Agromyces agglutinans TaxID=2662258 RepID=A0A6I2F803_9MICO|nr:Lrp/AsnC family transcriptional regulator [Agromyces agglutinans]MRG61625.1 AsnC family transcriptional regulator [Agromyces agglutinans]
MRSYEPDETDWAILRELQADARLSYNEIGRRIPLSAPSVAERVRRLEAHGIITGYSADVDPARVGQEVTAYIHLRCDSGRCLLKTADPDEYPEIVEIHKLAGRHCTLLRVRVASMAHFEGLSERIGTHGPIETTMVMSTPFARGEVRPTPPPRPVTTGDRWWNAGEASEQG